MVYRANLQSFSAKKQHFSYLFEKGIDGKIKNNLTTRGRLDGFVYSGKSQS
jgi:hypothetical protein